jgi:hypothetical protein
MRKLVAILSAVHAPPAWLWVVGIVGLTALVWTYSETSTP